MSGPFDLWRSARVSDISYLIKSQSCILMRAVLRYSSWNAVGLFLTARLIRAQSNCDISLGSLPPRGCLSCRSRLYQVTHVFFSASVLFVCVCLSSSYSPGAGMAAAEAVLSVPAPWSWRWFLTTAWQTCSSLPRHCAILSPTWWRQWWASGHFHLCFRQPIEKKLCSYFSPARMSGKPSVLFNIHLEKKWYKRIFSTLNVCFKWIGITFFMQCVAYRA